MPISRIFCSLSVFIFVASAAAAPASKLSFEKPEVFKIVDSRGRTPKFRVLDDSPSEQALAVAIASTINQEASVQPKLPMSGYLDLEIRKMSFAPVAKNPAKLDVTVNLSGYDVEIEKTVSRSALLAGELITLEFPKGEKSVSLFSINGNGHVKFRFDKKSSELVIEDAYGKMAYETPLDPGGTETIRFKGRGLPL